MKIDIHITSYFQYFRLTSEEKKTSSGSRIYKIEYKFDDNQAKNGNIHQVIVNETDTITFSYNAMNELTGITHPDSSTETLTYDDNGNLSTTTRNGETTTYTWNIFDRLTKVTLPSGEIVEFEYDSDGMLVKDNSAGVERKFVQKDRYASKEYVKNKQDDWELLAEHVLNGTMLSTHTFNTTVNAGIKSRSFRKSRVSYYHTDHLGSVRLVTDEDGRIVDSISTDAYGNPIPSNATMLQEFNFVGKYGIRYINKIKMHNMRARWYSEFERRFIAFDRLDDFNRYYYVKSNPTMRLDVDGRKSCQFAASFPFPPIYFIEPFDYSLKGLIESTISYCPKNKLLKDKLGDNISYKVALIGDRKMLTSENKFDFFSFPFTKYPDPITYEIQVGSGFLMTVQNYMDRAGFAVVLAHEFFHIQDIEKMKLTELRENFGVESNQMYSYRTCSVKGNEKLTITVYREWRAFYSSVQLADKILKAGGLSKKSEEHLKIIRNESYKKYLEFSEFMNYKQCCLEKYRDNQSSINEYCGLIV